MTLPPLEQNTPFSQSSTVSINQFEDIELSTDEPKATRFFENIFKFPQCFNKSQQIMSLPQIKTEITSTIVENQENGLINTLPPTNKLAVENGKFGFLKNIKSIFSSNKIQVIYSDSISCSKEDFEEIFSTAKTSETLGIRFRRFFNLGSIKQKIGESIEVHSLNSHKFKDALDSLGLTPAKSKPKKLMNLKSISMPDLRKPEPQKVCDEEIISKTVNLELPVEVNRKDEELVDPDFDPYSPIYELPTSTPSLKRVFYQHDDFLNWELPYSDAKPDKLMDKFIPLRSSPTKVKKIDQKKGLSESKVFSSNFNRLQDMQAFKEAKFIDSPNFRFDFENKENELIINELGANFDEKKHDDEFFCIHSYPYAVTEE
ncbi:hypothetical protein KGF54_004644 [Candida jiufengensis]|uniref:uncharacterized protein n=1 Tax=Candida jiufengensis TaxID=497108 RepID=UPI002225766A|nr:uncharacterized protein KGF54_004644 [Candida jiufengensis]KAI5951570.1 hypothetical protein KGF54_004644 [Candida jiufengensis]